MTISQDNEEQSGFALMMHPTTAGDQSVSDEHEPQSYSDEPRPRVGYAVLAGVYSASFAAVLLIARRHRRPLAPPVGVLDLSLYAIATHRLSRVIAKDLVTSFARAPFTHYEGHGVAHSEVEESARGTGMRRAIGDLLTCPFCMAQWVATLLWSGAIFAPQVTRIVARVFATVAIADALHLAYVKATKAASK